MNALWERVVGQERAVAILRAAAASPGDAYLFTGPPGTGKAEAARVFAAAVLCAEGCGRCSTCGRVLRGIHPDVLILEPEGLTYPIEAIRDAVAQAALTPMEGRRRLIVVEEADRIAERSQNALLKALEEPNPSVTWVLVTSVLQPILPTILSRCRIVEFTPVPEAAMAALVQGRAGLEESGAASVVRAARGDLGRALALATDTAARELRFLAIDAALAQAAAPDAVAALAAGAAVRAAALTARDASEKAAAAELAELEEVLGTGRGAAGARRRLGERARRAARRAETDVSAAFCTWLAQAYRDLAAVSAGAPAEALTAPDRAAELAAVAGNRSTAHWLRLAEESLAGEAAIRENALPALAVEAALLAPVALAGRG